MFKIINGGIFTTVQDAFGRPGYYSIGLAPSGAMDNFSMRIGNLLVGNDQNTAGLEIAFYGLKFEVLKDAVIAVTGGDLSPKLNGETLPMWETIRVKKGDTVFFAGPKSGATAYLSVTGGIDVPVVLGSRSTYTRGRVGGYKGRKLQAGDIIETVPTVVPLSEIENRKLERNAIPTFGKEWELRFIFGVTHYVYLDESKKDFLGSNWEVTSESDRCGYRLSGPKLNFIKREPPFGAGTDPSNIVDHPYPVGSIHCPAGVVPILLHRDAVTGGGYATLGTVISTDLDKVAQFKSKDIVRFREIDVEEAYRIRETKENFINQWKAVES